jgi:hypothetical protein
MPRVLRKLRIDEISAVDRGAGEGCKVVLYKRDDEPSFYQQLFARKPAVRKARYRDVFPGSRLHRIENLTREEAKHFLLHDRHGRALLRDAGGDIDELADHIVEASMRPTEKREVSNMDSTTRIEKNLRAMGEAAFTKIVTDYARKQFPTLTREQAFSKVFTAEDAEGQAIRRCWQLSKQGILDEDSAADAAGEVEDDAMDQLEELAADERKRNPKLTKAQAFAKAYTDPANAGIAAKERQQNRPRA